MDGDRVDQPEPGRSRLAHAAGAVIVFLVLMLPAGNFRTGMLGSGILDADSYSRLLRVERLLRHGGWYDSSTPWADGPPQGELHWTRPLDAIIAGLAIPLSASRPVREAVVLAGSIVPVVLGCALVVVMAWAAAPFTRRGLLLTGFAVVAQQSLATQFRFSYVDHHSLVVLLEALAWAGVVRTFAARSHAAATLAGVAAGLGVWVTVESLAWVAVLSAALAVLWLVEGEVHGGTLRRLYVAASMTSTAALMLEKPPGAWLSYEPDRLSAAHVLGLAAVAASLTMASRRGWAGSGSRLRRAAAIVSIFFVPAVLTLAVFPGVLRGPLAGIDPAAIPLLFEGNAEFNAFNAAKRSYVAAFAGAVIPIAIALVFCLLSLRSSDARVRRMAVTSLAFIAVFLPLTFYQWRWSMHAQMATVVPWLLAVRAAARSGRTSGPALRAAGVAAAIALAVGHIPLAILLLRSDPRPVPAPARAPQGADRGTQAAAGIAPPSQRRGRPSMGQCSFRGLGAAVGGPLRDDLVLAPFFDGPQIAWETGARVVAGPYHRNDRGIIDVMTAFTGDEVAARAVVVRRRVSYVVLCTSSSTARALVEQTTRGLGARLLQRRVPPWLAPVPIPRGGDPRLRVWRVLPERP